MELLQENGLQLFHQLEHHLFFLDASNASHGDMGQITSNDIVILISNSGQSEELKNIIQYTSRNKNIKLIGITSKKDSIII